MKSVRIAPGHTIIPDSQLFGGIDDELFDPEDSLDGSLQFQDARQEEGIDATSNGVNDGFGDEGPVDFDANQSMAFDLGSSFDLNLMDSAEGITMDVEGVVMDKATGEYYFNSVSQVPDERCERLSCRRWGRLDTIRVMSIRLILVFAFAET